MSNAKSRRPAVTQDDFERCVHQLLENNIEPTVSKIVKEIGGSFTTISAMYDKWQVDKNQSYDSSIPDFVKQASERMGQEWWSLVQRDVAERVANVESDAQARINQMKKQCDDYLDSIGEFEDALDSKTAEIESLIKSHDEAIKAVKSDVADSKKNQAQVDKKYQALVESSRVEREAIKAEFKLEKEKLAAQFEQQIQNEKAVAEKMEKMLRELIKEKDNVIEDMKNNLVAAS